MVKKWLIKIYRNRYFLLFIMLFGYIESISLRTSGMQQINWYTFTPEGAIFSLLEAGVLFATILFFIKNWQKNVVFSSKKAVKIFALSLVIFPLMMQCFGFVIAFAFDNVEANFNPKTLAYTTFTFFLHGFIYGSFFISYYYFINYKVHQAQLISYNQSLADSRINQLKIQLNPHFLFNNLNVLDQLIEEDKDKASEFLNEFAEIYRYVLQASDKKLTTINEEILFAQQYFNIMQHKYGKAYQLVIQNNLNEGYIVPMSLQLLVENAIQHNFGTDEKPTIINITITDKIEVSNNINRKAIIKATSGRALNNLKEQYKLLTEHPIEIIQSKETFTLVIPIVKRSLI